MAISIKIVKNKKELEDAFKIREIVFITEQKVPVDRERDEFDNSATHFLVFDGGNAVGTARVRFLDGKAKFERMAVLKEYRVRGVGRLLLKYMVDYAKEKGVKEITLGAQYPARGFYEKMGFKERGKIFMDAGIEHIEMYLSLTKWHE